MYSFVGNVFYPIAFNIAIDVNIHSFWEYVSRVTRLYYFIETFFFLFGITVFSLIARYEDSLSIPIFFLNFYYGGYQFVSVKAIRYFLYY